MRTIKFRAWDIGSSTMNYMKNRNTDFVFEFNDNWEMELWCPYHDDNWDYDTEKRDAIIMQFTWLIDKNWKEIYEGDIVEWDDNSNWAWRRRCEIKWEKTKYILVWYFYNANIKNSKKNPIDFSFWSFIYEYDWALEIIWNIHENPELLNK